MATQEYDRDFCAWTEQQAALLHAGRLQELDTEHLIKELDAIGARERRELVNCLALLLAHLLKWRLQPQRRGNSWHATIKVQRMDVQELIDQNPSLKHRLDDYFTTAYRKAILLAMKETGLDEDRFPKTPPFSLITAMDAEFWPD